MKTAFDCIPCFVRQAVAAVNMSIKDPQTKEAVLKKLLMIIAEADWQDMPVAIAQRIQRTVREATKEGDPYRELKKQMNTMALSLLPSLTEALHQHPRPREAAVRLAIAGNLMDAGSKNRLHPDDLKTHLDEIWHHPLAGNVDALFDAVDSADKILYLADNAGEIVFDRLLIEALPCEKVTVAVRGRPVLNDATMEDAVTAGLPDLVPVVANGSDAPGTIVSECSQAFRQIFDGADLIIAKGQGNYETLSETTKTTFFLLTVKCPAIAADIGAAVGDMVVRPAHN